MDRFEVTNREYRGFVDSGGYRRQEFWTEPIEKDGRVLPWREAMRLMTDRTGRTGPATWEAGDYPRGSGDDPVGGLSWYEAMAYARFTGEVSSDRDPLEPRRRHARQRRGSSRRAISRAERRHRSPGAGGSAHSERSTWPGTSASGVSTGPMASGSSWAAAGMTRRTASTIRMRRSPSTAPRLNGIRLVRYAPSEPNLARASAPHDAALSRSPARPAGGGRRFCRLPGDVRLRPDAARTPQVHGNG